MKEYQAEKAIISLTSWKARINTVGKTIFNLYKMCPGFHIVLCLYEGEFPNRENDLPLDLSLLVQNNKLELLWCKENLRPHLKYYYTMLKYKDTPIITVDDDGLYSKESIEALMNLYKKNKKSVICNRAHLILTSNGQILPYNKWKWVIKKSADNRHIFPTGVGGVLYPPNILDVENININELKQCLLADDIYLKVLENRKSISIKITDIDNMLRHPIEFNETKKTGLCNVNVHQNRNDKYIIIFEKDLL